MSVCSRNCSTLLIAITYWLVLFASVGVAQTDLGVDSPDPPPANEPVASTEETELASPRATMTAFLSAVNENRLSDAAKCLDLSQAPADGPSVAFQLKEVIDRIARIKLEDLPDDPEYEGPFSVFDAIKDLEQPTDPTERAAHQKKISDAKKIVLQRGGDDLWRFSAETVAKVGELYSGASERVKVAGYQSQASTPLPVLLREMFPESLYARHFILQDYQWICLLILVFLGFLADIIVRVICHSATATWFKYRKGESQDRTVEKKLWRPVGLLAQAIVWYVGTTLIGLPDWAMFILLLALKFFAVFASVWVGFLFIDLLAAYMARKAEQTQTKFDDILVPLVSKSLKVFVVCVGVLTCAQAFSLPIAGLVGGMGIASAAIVFASQDAISNIFGSVIVLTDRPFEIGDWIVTDGVEGTVETVGFRSTRIRTFYNSEVTLPNSRLTSAVVDNLGRRQYRRIKAMLGVQYDTTPEQMDAFCEGVRELIRRHPYTRKDYFHVYFNEFSDSSLNIMLYCFLECPDWAVELREKHRLFVDIMKLAERLGVSFAFPTRTLHMYSEQHASEESPSDLSAPEDFGKQLAAEIAGPLLSGNDRPGPVEFISGSSNRGDSDGEGA